MKNVLIVEDNPMNAELARLVLSKAGYETATVERADLAMDYLVGNQVDIILSDISMPGMSGKEFCRELRERLPEKRPRLVAYTAFAMHHQRQSIMEAGFDAIVVKPAKAETILKAIDPINETKEG
ncbi:MAG: response regulator [Burkholderiales bacterium]|jgi:two-component system, cell cycle response regulator DivK